ncbi:MAG: glycoside hydrolase 43 family protein [Clostridia bacterium]|nr:glycoside hydrolase 43 family protein [Clostridia bacterium]
MQYVNPILRGDYSDPDVIRVNEDFYMISSSFTYVPGIPVLHSKDLVHWELIGYAARHLPFARYDQPAHKCGAWAPSLRYHNGLFYVYVCMPDEGLFVFTTADPAGEWACRHIMDVSGWIDPCPLFDDDGRAYLVHGFAASRCGINNILYVHALSPDGMEILDRGRLVYSGAEHGDVTVEGPKFYKRNGVYWILCPAGGVKPGYQLALRADSVYGPYERRVVLRQGSTAVNGPHQGGWVDDGRGGDWFIHFQDIDAYGRVPHLQPVDWRDGWPLMGDRGEPVAVGDTGLPAWPACIPTSDDFAAGIGLQWQWQANPNPAWFTPLRPGLRLHAAPADSLFHAGQFLSQLMQDYNFGMDLTLRAALQPGDCAGIGMMGYPYHYAALEEGHIRIVRGDVQEINRRTRERVVETTVAETGWDSTFLRLRMQVRQGMMRFFFAGAEAAWQPLGDAYPLAPGGWTGARPGIFCLNKQARFGGWADVERVEFHPILKEIDQ